MAVKQEATVTFEDEQIDIVTLTVAGNVPKHFVDMTVTELTFAKNTQARALYEDLKSIFE